VGEVGDQPTTGTRSDEFGGDEPELEEFFGEHVGEAGGELLGSSTRRTSAPKPMPCS